MAWRWLLADLLAVAALCNYLTAYFGFAPRGFYSSDYFPLLPWVFLFWAGVFLHWALGRHRMEPLRRSVCPGTGVLGRHSLVAYLLHQPVIYGLLLILDQTFLTVGCINPPINGASYCQRGDERKIWVLPVTSVNAATMWAAANATCLRSR